MKKVHSLKTMSKLSGRAWNPVPSPNKDPFSRSKSTSSLLAILEAAKVEGEQLQGVQMKTKVEGKSFEDR
jgi:hypothetical protein